VSGIRSERTIQVGLVAEEPIRLEGLITVFETLIADGQARLVPAPGRLDELLSKRSLRFLIFDMNSASGGIDNLELIRRTRPDLRIVVIGPEGNDEFVLECIIAGARAYLDVTAEPRTIRTAINAVIEGSIWAPRRLLSKLIDRLLTKRDTSLTNADPHLTAREHQVLELILLARSNREIACQLGIEERTVKAHVGRLMRKTGVDNRIELTMRAMSRTLSFNRSAGPAEDPRLESGIDS
jgi:DNA-binding NarL/FixJ family response regulator